MVEIIKELKSMLHKAKSPKMDSEHINIRGMDKLLTKLYNKSEELEKQNKELLNECNQSADRINKLLLELEQTEERIEIILKEA